MRKKFLGVLLGLVLTLGMPGMCVSTYAEGKDSGTYVITSENFSDYFDENGYLKEGVEEGSVLDFQGEFIGTKYTLYIDKKVTITSTTEDAYFENDSESGRQCQKFNLVEGADYTTVSNLDFLNCVLSITEVTNVTVDNVNMVANQSGVGGGIGFLSIHTGTENIVVKNSSFENGGTGSSILLAGKGTKNSVFENNTFRVSGSSGNCLYLTTFLGDGDAPEGNILRNNTFIMNTASSPFCYHLVNCGTKNVIEGNDFKNCNNKCIENQALSQPTDCIYRNNTISGGGSITICQNSTAEGNVTDGPMVVLAESTVTGNTVGKLTISGKDCKVSMNNINGNVKFNGSAKNTVFKNNQVNGTLNIASNGSEINDDVIVSSQEYAVYLESNASDNDVEYNAIIAAGLTGDDAVNPGTGSENTIDNNGAAFVLQGEWIQAIDDKTYVGEAIEPEVVVKKGERALIADKDYTVAYSDNIDAGTATVTISAVEGSGYEGAATASFTINKAAQEAPAEKFTTTKASETDKADGKISGFDKTKNYQYSADSGKTWIDVTGKAEVEVKAGTYQIRYAESKNYEVGESVTVKIEVEEKKDDPEEKKETTNYKSEWIKGQWYDANGKSDYKPQGSWKTNGTGWWYEDTSGWYPVSCWQKIDEKWYYFDATGYLLTDAFVVDWSQTAAIYWKVGEDGAWDGEDAYRWHLSSSKWWFGQVDGKYVSDSWQYIDGKWYCFDKEGYLLTSQYVGDYWVNANGAWEH